MNPIKLLLNLGIFAAVLIALLWGFAHFIAPYAIMQPSRQYCIDDGSGGREEYSTIIAHDSVRLDAYHYPTANAKSVIILLHGINSCKECFLGLSAWLARHGVATFAIDSRGHGRSEGQYNTFGFKERHDVRKAIDYLRTIYPDTVTIGIWGNSLGGAIALQAMSVDTRIDYGIVESTFSDLKDVVYEYQKRYALGIGLWPLTDYALRRAGQIGAFDPERVCPKMAASNITRPVLVAHGDADVHIPVENGREIYRLLGGSEKELLIVPGADHTGLYSVGGEAFKLKLLNYIKRVYRPGSNPVAAY